MTDIDGRFVLAGLPSGSYLVEASHSLYAKRRDNIEPQPPMAPVQLGNGAVTTGVTIELFRRAAIEGIVTDALRRPMIEVEVKALRRRIVDGHDLFELSATTRTDDRGIYRIGKLEPGEYLAAVASSQMSLPQSLIGFAMGGDRLAQRAMATAIYVKGQPAGFSPADWQTLGGQLFRSRDGSPPSRVEDGRRSPVVFTTTFYPQTPNQSAATLIRLKPGETLRGVDFRPARVQGTLVSGRVTRGSATLPSAVVIRLLRTDSGAIDLEPEVAVTVSDSEGQFQMIGVPPGQYLLVAQSEAISSDDGGYQIQELAVAEDGLSGVQVSFRPGLRVGGRLTSAGSSAALPQGPDIWLERLDGVGVLGSQNEWGRVAVNMKGEFLTTPVPAGRYILRSSDIPGWSLESTAGPSIQPGARLSLGQADELGVEVRFTQRPSSVTGLVTGIPSATGQSCLVVFLRTDSLAYVRPPDSFVPGVYVGQSDLHGSYSVQGLPAGPYRVLALERLPRLTPDLIRQLMALSGVGLEVTQGGRHALDVRLSSLRR